MTLCYATNGDNNTTSYGYDAAGNPTSMTPPSPLGAVSMSYDAAGRMTGRAVAGGTTCTAGSTSCVQYGYDNAGNLTSRSDAAGTTTISYDPQNRAVQKKTVNAGITTADSSAGYDPAGNLTGYTEASSVLSSDSIFLEERSRNVRIALA